MTKDLMTDTSVTHTCVCDVGVIGVTSAWMELDLYRE